jgi:hypothetical protein
MADSPWNKLNLTDQMADFLLPVSPLGRAVLRPSK